MPGKMLFGRMRPEVIESRVVGLDNFLQLCMVTPLYASCPVLTDFLTRGMDAPPPGLDLVDDTRPGSFSYAYDDRMMKYQRLFLVVLVVPQAQVLASYAAALPGAIGHWLGSWCSVV